MGARGWLASDRGVAIVAAAATLLALAENTVAPWAPYYVVYVVAVTVLPFVAGTWAFGRITSTRATIWILAVVGPLLLQVLGGLWSTLAYPAVAGWFGATAETLSGPYHSLDAALATIFESRGASWGTEPRALMALYFLGILVWAGLGEELFYRGYIHGALRRRHGFAFAAVVSAAFFGVRHATQLALVQPSYPWGAAVTWVGLSFVVGIFLSYLYERSGSLYPPVLAHYLFNLVPLAFLLAGPEGG